MIAIKVNVSSPRLAQRAAATGADGVGLVRLEHLVYTFRHHPRVYLSGGRATEYRNLLVEGLMPILEAFKYKPVWVRTLDAPTDELREMDGGAGEPEEANPMIGWRGIRRDLDERDHLAIEAEVFRTLWERGHTNLGIMLPMVSSREEIMDAKLVFEGAGLNLDAVPIGVMIETPAAALVIRDLIDEGIRFVSFGTNDLTQLTLGVDRTHPKLEALYNEVHPAVLQLVARVVDACTARRIETSVCGEAASDPERVRRFIELGVTAVSVNIDAVAAVRAACAQL